MTQKHKETIDFILMFWEKYGYAPSYEEIAVGVGLRSRSAVHSLIKRMAARNLVVVLPRKARSIKVVQ